MPITASPPIALTLDGLYVDSEGFCYCGEHHPCRRSGRDSTSAELISVTPEMIARECPSVVFRCEEPRCAKSCAAGTAP